MSHALPVEREEIDEFWDVVILGGGYAGLMAAMRLSREARHGTLRVALVNPNRDFVERIRLQDAATAAAAGGFALPEFLAATGVAFIQANAIHLDADQSRIVVRDDSGADRAIQFGRAIIATGLVPGIEQVAGAATVAFRMTASGPRSVPALRGALAALAKSGGRVLVIGGGASGIELAAGIRARWPSITVAIADRGSIGSFSTARVEALLREELDRAGIEMIDDAQVEAVDERYARLGDGRRIIFDLCVISGAWRGADVVRNAGLTVDATGRARVDGCLRSLSHPRILVAGDAARPEVSTGAPYRPSAFVALVSGAHAADVILSERKGREPRGLSFATFGQGIALGNRGIGFATFPADAQRGPIYTGAFALRLRGFFVRMLLRLLYLERWRPGTFFWFGYRSRSEGAAAATATTRDADGAHRP